MKSINNLSAVIEKMKPPSKTYSTHEDWLFALLSGDYSKIKDDPKFNEWWNK
jgi:hypothetical protein